MTTASPGILPLGQRVLAQATRVPGLRENQMAIMRWLFDLGHEIDDDEFFEELLDEGFVWHFIK